MSDSTNLPHPLALVLEHGKKLKTLLQSAKSDDQSTLPNKIVDDVEKSITTLLGLLRPDALFPEESVARFLKRIVETLDAFIECDRDPDCKDEYKRLASLVNDHKPQANLIQVSAPAASTLLAHTAHHNLLSTTSTISEDELKVAVEDLPMEEKLCLTCFALFPPDMDIKKRELSNCWERVVLLYGPVDVNYILARLVWLGLVERVSQKNRFLGRYKIHQCVRSYLLSSTDFNVKYGSNWSGFISPYYDGAVDPLVKSAEGVEVFRNISQTILNPARLKILSKMKKLRVLHLGSWLNDPSIYIVAEGIKAIKDLNKLTYLSLQGISCIEKLPDSVYMLHTLLGLDLRACHNLKSITAEGIINLVDLQFLDVSECYLLDYLPRAIIKLINLKVLKGFIITSAIPGKLKTKGEYQGPCSFTDLSELRLLKKLTVRTRRMSFPTIEDLGTLCQLGELRSLSIAWIGSLNYDFKPCEVKGSFFPVALQKLELQAAPERTASFLLSLISASGFNCLEKLCIRGGGLSDLNTEKHQLHNVKVLRLRYLPYLCLHWPKFRSSFSGLNYLEIQSCPNLVFFPCDQNGVWESTEDDSISAPEFCIQ